MFHGEKLDLPEELPLEVSVLHMSSLSIIAIAITTASSPPLPLNALAMSCCIFSRVLDGFSMPQRYAVDPAERPPGRLLPAGQGTGGDGGDGDGRGDGPGDGPGEPQF